jgi:DNA-directed RNA polymerase specialized sigma24 family protein
MFRGANDAAVFVYIGRVAISVVIDHLRRNGARKRGTETVSLDALLPSDDGQEVTLGDCIAAPGASPEQEACASVLRSEVSEILSRLLRGRNATRDLRIAEACIFEGASLAEVSESLGGIRESGVKSSVRRTSLRLRSELSRLERQTSSRRSRYPAR